MKAVDILIAARALIANPGDWVKYLYERPKITGGVSRCAVGAIMAAVRKSNPPYDGPLDELAQLKALGVPFRFRLYNNATMYLFAAIYATDYGSGPCGVTKFNDSVLTSHEDVLDAFDRAIKNAKRRHLLGDRQRRKTTV